MLSSYFIYIIVHLRQKACLRPELSPKFLSTLGPSPARPEPELDPKSPARLTTLLQIRQSLADNCKANQAELQPFIKCMIN